MTTLTEQYLNGNIKDGTEWYVKNRKGEIFTMYLYNDTCHYHSFKTKKLEVLDEVPSYEELQNQAFILKSRESEIVKKETQRIKLMTKLNDVNNKNHALRIENDKLKAIKEKTYNYDYLSECYSKFIKENKELKELLKECIIYVDRYVAFSVVQGNEEKEVKSKELLTKINQVLGEE